MTVNVTDKILRRICSISNHPIAKLDKRLRVLYVNGLGACMYELSKGNAIIKMSFSVWAKSILQDIVVNSTIWKKDHNAICEVTSTKIMGFDFPSMDYQLFFDVFYLTRLNGMNIILKCEKIYNYLLKVCGPSNALKDVFNFFKERKTCPEIAHSLILHKEKNEWIFRQREKRILVVANVSAGKSTLVNALIGHRLNRAMNRACTSKIVSLHNKVSNDGITVRHNDGSFTYHDEVNAVNSDDFIEVAFPFNSTLENSHICLIDTPGVNNSEDLRHRQITEDAIKKNDYDAIIYVSNCQYFGTFDEQSLLSLLKAKTSKPIFFVLNQLDRFKKKDDSIEGIVEHYQEDLVRLGFNEPKIFPLSAHAALFMKLRKEEMDEEDQEEKIKYEKKFQQGYYNLPSYVEESTFDPTGIGLLEQRLKEL